MHRERVSANGGQEPRISRLGAKFGRCALNAACLKSGLAEGIGLTFQQVQKYEKGANRVSAGRLQQISNILNVPITFF